MNRTAPSKNELLDMLAKLSAGPATETAPKRSLRPQGRPKMSMSPQAVERSLRPRTPSASPEAIRALESAMRMSELEGEAEEILRNKGAKGYMGGGKVRGYKKGGCVMKGRGGSFKGTF